MRQISDIKIEFGKRFEMKDLGKTRTILGIDILRDRRNKKLFPSQNVYVDTILSRFGMQSSKPVRTPMDKVTNEVD